MNKRFERIANNWTNQTVEDSIFGAMITLEDLSKEFGVEITKTQNWYKLDEDTYLNVTFTQKSALWVALDIYDKADYEHITVEYVEEMRADYAKYVEEMNDLEREAISFEEYAGL